MAFRFAPANPSCGGQGAGEGPSPKRGWDRAATPPQGHFRLNPFGRRIFWPRSALLVGHRSIADMLSPRVLHAVKICSPKPIVISGTGR
jgi:hypothetical protein